MAIDRIRQQKKLALEDIDNDQNLRRKILHWKPDRRCPRYLWLLPIWWATAIRIIWYIYECVVIYFTFTF